jgi:hypothetical protein
MTEQTKVAEGTVFDLILERLDAMAVALEATADQLAEIQERLDELDVSYGEGYRSFDS